MKKNILTLFAIGLISLFGYGQSVVISNGGVSYSYPMSSAGEIIFNDPVMTISGKTFNLTEWSKIHISKKNIEENTVEIQYDDVSANVLIAGNIAPYVSATVNGAHVSITQDTSVSDATSGEIIYVLSGESADGSLSMTGNYKSTLELRGVSLTNPCGAAIDIQNGKRIAMSAKNGTENILIDGDGSQKGAIVCKGHIELKGKGQLTVTGNKSHAIYAKEYVEIKNLTLNIAGSVKDGINCGQYFLMESGNVTLSNIGDDGIQVSYKDDVDREAEDTGDLTINGGSLCVSVKADAVKCLKADNNVVINGGNLTLSSDANGIWDSAKQKTKSSACIGADGDVVIKDGTLSLTATGSGGKGISCDGIFTCDGGALTIATTGGLLVYSNGSLNHNYTGNAERISSDNKSSAKGIKADSGVVINGGTLHVSTSTNNSEGIESKKELDINGGDIFVHAYDDGINSSGDFRVSGGNLTVISSVGDGLDSNGNLTISGGYIRTMGSGGMEMGLDASTETGCAVYITGGTLMAFGGNNTYPNKSGSTQPFVKVTGSIKADTYISISSGSETLAEFKVPSEYVAPVNSGFNPGGWRPGGTSGSGSLLISCPQLATGQAYTIQNGTTTSTASAILTSSGR